MEDATIVMNDADEELVEYFEYVVRERIYYILQLTGRKGGNYLYIFWKGQARNN